MATKTLCDKCGNEITSIVPSIKIGAKAYDLCAECLDKLHEFLDNKV